MDVQIKSFVFLFFFTLLISIIPKGYAQVPPIRKIAPSRSGGLTPLHLAARSGNAEKVQQLLQQGADPNARSNPPARRGVSPMASNVDWTPLHYSITSGSLEIVDLLLASGAQADLQTSNGWSPIMMSVSHNEQDIFRRLLEEKASISIINNEGQSAIDIAFRFDRREMANTLIELAGPEMIRQYGHKWLLSAVKLHYIKAVETLIRKGVDIDHTYPNNRTALFYAILLTDKEMASKLLSLGADPEIQENTGDTPYALALRRGYTELAVEILSAGASAKLPTFPVESAVQLYPEEVYSSWKSNNGKFLFLSDYEKSFLYEIKTGLLIRTFSGHLPKTGEFMDTDLKIAVTQSSYATILAWDLEKGVNIRQFHAPKDAYYEAFTIHPQATYIATIESNSYSDNTHLTIWDISTGRVAYAQDSLLQQQDARIEAIFFSEEGNLLTVNTDKGAFYWDIQAGGNISERHSPPPMTAPKAQACSCRDSSNLEYLNRWKTKHGDDAPSFPLFSNYALWAASRTAANSYLWDLGRNQLSGTIPFPEMTAFDLSPDRKMAALASWEGKLWLWDMERRSRRWEQQLGYEIFDITFSPDGAWIIGQEEQWDDNEFYPIALDTRSGEKHTAKPSITHWNTIAGFSFDKNNQLISYGFDKQVFLWKIDQHGLRGGQKIAGSSRPITSASLRPDAKEIAFTVGEFGSGLDYGKTVIYDARSGTRLRSIYQESGSVEMVRYSPDGKFLAVGGENNEVYLRDPYNSELLHTLSGHKATIRQSAFSPDGRHLATVGDDSEIRLWNTAEGQMLYKMMLFEDKSIVLTRDNFYQAPRSEIHKMHFVRKNTTYTFDQFDLRLNRPDKVLEAMAPLGADTALIRQYRQAYQKRLEKYGFTEDMLSDDYQVPECAITNSDQLPISTTEEKVQLQIEALDSLRLLDRLNVFVNDVPIYGISGINLRPENTQEYTTTLNIPLSRGSNKIQVSALNQGGAESLKATTYITYDAPERKPNLYLLTIGVSNYQAKGKDLQYAAKDALDIAEYYQNATAFDQTYIKTLTDEQVTKANILALRQWLENTNVDDQVMLYVSGHGLLDQNYDFYYATHDIDFADPSQKGILYDEIEGLLDGLPARKKLLLMDACHSGEYDADAPPLTTAQQNSLAQKGVSFKGFSKGDDEGSPSLGLQNSFEMMQQLFADLRRGSGATVITSSAGVQVSFEDEDWQNGAFTYAFLYGLKSMKADSNQDGQVTASEIQAFVAEYVPRLTEGLQVPTFRRENLEFDFRVW